MEKFDLSVWLKDKSRKVVTRDGRDVRIICWDAKDSKPIVALVLTRSISRREFDELTINYYNDGTYYGGGVNEDFLDLFFADEEEKLSEFEKELQIIISEASRCTSEDGSMSMCLFGDKEIKKISGQILDITRKELQPEFDKKMDKLLAETDKVVYQKGQQDALKDLPKWKKMPSGIQGNGDFNPTYLVRVSNGYYFTTPCLSWDKDCMYIELSELEKLPKEE